MKILHVKHNLRKITLDGEPYSEEELAILRRLVYLRKMRLYKWWLIGVFVFGVLAAGVSLLLGHQQVSWSDWGLLFTPFFIAGATYPIIGNARNEALEDLSMLQGVPEKPLLERSWPLTWDSRGALQFFRENPDCEPYLQKVSAQGRTITRFEMSLLEIAVGEVRRKAADKAVREADIEVKENGTPASGVKSLPFLTSRGVHPLEANLSFPVTVGK